MTPHVGPTVMHPAPQYDAVRVWRAPRDGTVTVRGRAEHIGGGDVDLSVLRITELPVGEKARQAEMLWTLKTGDADAGRRASLPSRTAQAGKEFRYRLTVPPGLYTVHLKFAELWLKEPGQRPMDITINNRLVWKAWDPAAAAGQMRMAADVRTEDVTPDKDGHITIHLKAAGPNPAILQGLEVE